MFILIRRMCVNLWASNPAGHHTLCGVLYWASQPMMFSACYTEINTQNSRQHEIDTTVSDCAICSNDLFYCRQIQTWNYMNSIPVLHCTERLQCRGIMHSVLSADMSHRGVFLLVIALEPWDRFETIWVGNALENGETACKMCLLHFLNLLGWLWNMNCDPGLLRSRHEVVVTMTTMCNSHHNDGSAA